MTPSFKEWSETLIAHIYELIEIHPTNGPGKNCPDHHRVEIRMKTSRNHPSRIDIHAICPECGRGVWRFQSW